jgi:luciferase family oxidoreductase group 1
MSEKQKNKKELGDISLSVLDLATVTQGHTPADSFKNSLDLAQHAERWGFKRFWLAEHHNMESIASSATAVLIAHIAGGTTTIRVGSGGIMLPNHAPLIVAEQFGTLESLYPGRIDLGLGRAPGTDQETSLALRRNLRSAGTDFPEHVEELMTYLSAENSSARVRAFPGEGLNIPIWLLGSSTFSAQLAAYLGLPFAFASHFAPTNLHAALKIYRETFRPSASLQEPYAIACVNVMAANSDEEAEHIATSMKIFALGILHNTRKPLQPPVKSMEGIWNEAEKAAVQQLMYYSFVGGPDTVKQKLEGFLEETGVNELMVVSHIYEHAARIRSYEILTEIKEGVAQPI